MYSDADGEGGSEQEYMHEHSDEESSEQESEGTLQEDSEPDEEWDPICKALTHYKGKAFATGTLQLEKPLKVFTAAGCVDFPLSKEGAEILLKASSPAPFGRASETVLDPEYRLVTISGIP